MAGEKMDIETAEQQLKSMEHSEQHYFNRLVFFTLLKRRGFCSASSLCGRPTPLHD